MLADTLATDSFPIVFPYFPMLHFILLSSILLLIFFEITFFVRLNEKRPQKTKHFLSPLTFGILKFRLTKQKLNYTVLNV